jgi:hypothetical protein
LQKFLLLAYIVPAVNMPPGTTPVGNVAVEGLPDREPSPRDVEAGWSRPNGLNDEATHEREIAMKVQKFTAGAVFVGAIAAGLVSAAPAFAGPGINYDNGTGGTGNVKFGDTSATGATAIAGTGSQALAINTGLNLNPIPGSRAAAGPGGNTAVAIDGITLVAGENNNGFSALGATVITGGKNNNVVTVGGSSLTAPDAHDNSIVNFGGSVTPKTLQGTNPGALSVSVCGTPIGAQAAHITVKPLQGGLC